MAGNQLLGQWSLTANTNGFAIYDGAPENWVGADVNGVIRELMAVIRTWYDDPEWLTITEDLTSRGAKTVVKVDASNFQIQNCDASAYYSVGRRVRMRGATTEESHVKSVAFSSPHTNVEIIGSNVPAAILQDGVDVYFSKTIDQSAFTAQPAVGDVKLTAGLQASAAANGWLECNGQEVDIEVYPELASALGSPTGALTGYYDYHPSLGVPTIGFVRLPDLAGRVPVGFWDDTTHPDGADPDGEYDYTNGGSTAIKRAKAWVGEKNHEILEAEMPAHDHDAVSDGAHTHDLEHTTKGTGTTGAVSRLRSPEDTPVFESETIQSAGAHDHSIVSQGDAANNKLDLRQASVVMGYVIYTGVIP